MLHEFHLGESWKTNIAVAERNALIRYCLSVGTRAKCSTRAVMRPFKQKYLTAALRELRKNFMQKISEYTEWMQTYVEGETKLPDWMIDYFEGIPTKEIFTDYCCSVIKQERGTLRSLMKNYSIRVDFAFTDKKWLAFHYSLNPRVTFGYSNRLHEVCDFALTEEVKNAFLNSSLKELSTWEQDWTHDWGYVYFDSITNLLYEDLAVLIGERYILDTVSHEEMMTVSLTDEELTAFIDFEGKRNENLATIEKLKSLNEAKEKNGSTDESS